MARCQPPSWWKSKDFTDIVGTADENTSAASLLVSLNTTAEHLVRSWDKLLRAKNLRIEVCSTDVLHHVLSVLVASDTTANCVSSLQVCNVFRSNESARLLGEGLQRMPLLTQLFIALHETESSARLFECISALSITHLDVLVCSRSRSFALQMCHVIGDLSQSLVWLEVRCLSYDCVKIVCEELLGLHCHRLQTFAIHSECGLILSDTERLFQALDEMPSLFRLSLTISRRRDEDSLTFLIAYLGRKFRRLKFLSLFLQIPDEVEDACLCAALARGTYLECLEVVSPL